MLRFILFAMMLAAAGQPALGLCAPIDQSEETKATDAVEAGRQAFNDRTSYPWYDSAKDATRAIKLPADKEANFKRDESSARTLQPTTPAPAVMRPVRSSGGLGLVLQVIGALLLLALIVAIAVVVARTFMVGEVIETKGTKVVKASREVDQVEHLPVQIRSTKGDFLEEARVLMETGRYDQAIIFLYSYQLLQLDKHQVIRLTKGKTNRQYLREARSSGRLAQILEQTMVPFEDVFFGHHSLSAEDFSRCWNQVTDFRQELSKLGRVAA